ncbi:MAG: helix-turn-helix domain-containing protein [Planctomycetota bacterium]
MEPRHDITCLGEKALAELVECAVERQLKPLQERLGQLMDRLDRTGTPPPPEKLLTVKELAALLRFDPRTIRRKEVAGTVPEAIRVGASKRWRLSDVLRYLDKLEGESRG